VKRKKHVEFVNVRMRKHVVEELKELKAHPRQPLYEVIEDLLAKYPALADAISESRETESG